MYPYWECSPAAPVCGRIDTPQNTPSTPTDVLRHTNMVEFVWLDSQSNGQIDKPTVKIVYDPPNLRNTGLLNFVHL